VLFLFVILSSLTETQTESQAFVIRRKGTSREYEPNTPRKNETEDTPRYIPKLRSTVHEIIIRNQVMQLDPPLDYARANLVTRFNNWLGEY
jgi:hypothetical protein